MTPMEQQQRHIDQQAGAHYQRQMDIARFGGPCSTQPVVAWSRPGLADEIFAIVTEANRMTMEELNRKTP